MKWQDPPAGSETAQRHPRKFPEEAAELKANPDRWALLATFPADQAKAAETLRSNVRTGQYAAFQPGKTFEARLVVRDDERDVYARYVGEQTSQPDA